MSRILSLVLVCACAAACGSSASSPLAPAAAPQPTSVTNVGGTDAGEAARGPVAATAAEQETLKAELREMRTAYERNRRWMLLIAVVIGGLAMVAWSWNPAFALALVLFAIAPMVLAWKNSTAVRKIDEGLARAR